MAIVSQLGGNTTFKFKVTAQYSMKLQLTFIAYNFAKVEYNTSVQDLCRNTAVFTVSPHLFNPFEAF